MCTIFVCASFLNTPRDPGHPGRIPGTSQIPLFETQGRQSFEGGHELFGHHPFAWKTPTPSGGLRTQKVNPCAFLSFLKPWDPSFPEKKTGRILFREYCFGREKSLSLAEFYGKLGEFSEKLGESALAHK